MGLTQEQINTIFANRRKKGEYLSILDHARNESDENGFAAKATFPQLKGKTSTTIYQGFRNAAEKLGITDDIEIINSDDEVYVIFSDRVELAS